LQNNFNISLFINTTDTPTIKLLAGLQAFSNNYNIGLFINITNRKANNKILFYN